MGGEVPASRAEAASEAFARPRAKYSRRVHHAADVCL